MIKFNKQNAINTFKSASLAIGKTLPYQSFMMIESNGNRMTVSASNGSVSISASCDIESDKDDVICIESEKLMKTINSLDGDISIVVEKSDAIIKSGRSKIKIQTMNPSDFPKIDIDFSESSTVDAGEFINKIQSISHSSGVNDVRYFLNGCFIDSKSMVASDGHRLSYTDHGLNIEDKTIVPTQMILRTIKLINSKDIDISIDPDRFQIRSGDIDISIKTINSKYPQWRNILFDDDIKLNVDIDNLLNALKIASIASDFAIGSIKAEKNILSIKSSSKTSSSSSDIDCQCDDFEIGINLNYLIQSIESKQGDISIGINKEKGVILSDGESHEYIMMARL